MAAKDAKGFLESAEGKKAVAEEAKKQGAAKKTGSAADSRGLGYGMKLSISEQLMSLSEKDKTGLASTLKRYEEFSSRIQTLGAQSAKGSGQIIQDLQRLQKENMSLGLTMKKTMAAVGEAMESYFGVATTNWPKDRLAITKQIAVYKQLGVASGDVTSVMNLFGGSLGKSRNEVTKTSQILNKFAKTTGQSYKKVWSDFNQNVGQFMTVMDSKDMQRQTLLMTTRARRMGVSVNQMMGSLQQFETLEGAQQAAGKINAVMGSLGGSFDAVKAAGMDFTERQQYVAKTIQNVYGRIEQSGPRAGRAYIGALADAFGMDARTIKAMATARPGAALPAELRAGRGLIGGLTTAQTEMAAKEAASLEDHAQAMRDSREAFLMEIVPKSMGLTATEIISKIKVGSADLESSIAKAGMTMGDNAAQKLVAGITAGLPAMMKKFGASDADVYAAMGGVGNKPLGLQ